MDRESISAGTAAPKSTAKLTNEKSGQQLDQQCLDIMEANSAEMPVQIVMVSQMQKIILFTTLGLVSFVLFLDSSTTTTCLQYAASDLNGYSLYATVSTSAVIVCLVIQTPLTTASDILGLGTPFSFCILFLTVGYALCATSRSMGALAAGSILASIGMFGLLVLGQLVISHYTSTRARTLGIAMFYLPTIVTPFISSALIERVLVDLGWRRNRITAIRPKFGIYEFFSRIAGVGNILLVGGFGLTLLPTTFAGTGLATFQTPYIIVLLVLGIIFLLALFVWECWVAAYSILPSAFFRNKTIVLVALTGALDYFGLNVSHTYLYSWAVAARDMNISQANLLLFLQTVVSCGTMILVGLFVFKMKQYKWIVVAGCIIRTVGYGVMLRLRGAENSAAEIFGVQVIQGIGTGVMEALLLPAVQFAVPQSNIGHVTGILQLFRFTGQAIGITASGAIYNSLFLPSLWKYMPVGTDPTTIEAVYNSLLGVLPEWGSIERTSITEAYGDIMRYMVIAAVASSAPILSYICITKRGKPAPTQKRRNVRAALADAP
ncbi:hypothetical protein E8E14_006227 [Neopestalotiopsis sp. 37M]|nr:hypothetical protein E8E14_006227 [Neopestalotiopsis sp. 37M]